MLALLVCSVCSLAACSSSNDPESAGQVLPAPGGGTNSPPRPGGGNNPGPTVPAVRFDDAFVSLGKPGAFPSDLVAGGDGTLYSVDDATIPAKVVAFDSGGAPLFSIPIGASQLVDMDSTTPARTPISFGTGLFGAFTGDLELCFDRYLLVTVGGGNSFSTDSGGNFLRLANLVLIDTRTRRVVQTINLAWTKLFAGRLSSGGDVLEIPQSLPVMCRFVPDGGGTETGKVYVAMSNGAGTSAGLGSFFQGTVQVWSADFRKAQPLGPHTSGTPATDLTRTYVSDNFNPVGLTRYATRRGTEFLILTLAGASLFDASFVVQPTTDAYLEFLDLPSEQWRPAWSVNLGPILPAVQQIAVGRDATGLDFGLLTSQTFAAAYAVDLSGLESNPVDPGGLRMAHTVDLEPGGATRAGSGFQPSIALTPSGQGAVFSSFSTSSLGVLRIPSDIEFGLWLLDPGAFATADMTASGALGLATVLVRGDEALVLINGDFDSSFAPQNPGRIGRLESFGRLP